MLETLNTTTMVVGTGLIASPTTTSFSGAKKVTNPETKKEEWDLNGFKMSTGTVAASTTTFAPTIQDMEYQRVINEARSEMAIVEFASDEELARSLEQLEMLELSAMFEEEATNTLGEYGDAKKPYTK